MTPLLRAHVSSGGKTMKNPPPGHWQRSVEWQLSVTVVMGFFPAFGQ
jgi:hypothetical protein